MNAFRPARVAVLLSAVVLHGSLFAQADPEIEALREQIRRQRLLAQQMPALPK